jgi:uncharacterized YigZ family protein
MDAGAPIPASPARAEMLVKNSRFIADVGPAFSVAEAKAFISQIKGEFADASHHVPAFLIGHGNSVIAHCSDAGEPSGTAGRPVLSILQGSGLGDVVLVVTRYFGGTKLGTGGLVRAYSDAARSVLEVLPRAVKIPTMIVTATFPYTYYERMRLLVSKHGGKVLEEAFEVGVSLLVQFAATAFNGFQSEVRDLTNGTIQAEIVSEDTDTIMPLSGTNLSA